LTAKIDTMWCVGSRRGFLSMNWECSGLLDGRAPIAAEAEQAAPAAGVWEREREIWFLSWGLLNISLRGHLPFCLGFSLTVYQPLKSVCEREGVLRFLAISRLNKQFNVDP
jgi:hypothetical protein